MLAALIDAGPRIGELTKLTRTNIDDDGATLTGKTGAHRIPLSTTTRTLLTGLGTPEHLWTSAAGKPLTYWGMHSAFRRILNRAGITGPKLGPHTIRHTFGRLWIRDGHSLPALQRILGHASITTTQIYVELADEEAADAHRNWTLAADLLGRTQHAG